MSDNEEVLSGGLEPSDVRRFSSYESARSYYPHVSYSSIRLQAPFARWETEYEVAIITARRDLSFGLLPGRFDFRTHPCDTRSFIPVDQLISSYVGTVIRRSSQRKPTISPRCLERKNETLASGVPRIGSESRRQLLSRRQQIRLACFPITVSVEDHNMD